MNLSSPHSGSTISPMADIEPLADATNNLEDYWKHGEGAAKIGWGTHGDWTRCYHHLRKHMVDDLAKRTCAQWHHDVTGVWPGSKDNP